MTWSFTASSNFLKVDNSSSSILLTLNRAFDAGSSGLACLLAVPVDLAAEAWALPEVYLLGLPPFGLIVPSYFGIGGFRGGLSRDGEWRPGLYGLPCSSLPPHIWSFLTDLVLSQALAFVNLTLELYFLTYGLMGFFCWLSYYYAVWVTLLGEVFLRFELGETCADFCGEGLMSWSCEESSSLWSPAPDYMYAGVGTAFSKRTGEGCIECLLTFRARLDPDDGLFV